LKEFGKSEHQKEDFIRKSQIYAQCSIDYDLKSDVTLNFYKTVQNKLHWAITGNTAAEIIESRANTENPNMGLTTWKNLPSGKILKFIEYISLCCKLFFVIGCTPNILNIF
jgi:hypothetical protein